MVMTFSPPGYPFAPDDAWSDIRIDAHPVDDLPRRRGTGASATTTRRLEAIAAYGRAWTLEDESAIGAELEHCWTQDSTHVTAFTDLVRGIGGLTRLILDLPVLFPGATLQTTSPPDIQQDAARIAWRLQSTSRIRVLGRDFGYTVDGTDHVDFSADHRIRRVVATFGSLTDLVAMPDARPRHLSGLSLIGAP
jgi:hypothetical protein